MCKEIISDKQGICVITLFTIGSTLILGAAGEAKSDAWIAIIAALMAGLIISQIYARLLFLFPRKDLFEILEIVFGKIFGRIIGCVFVWYAFHLGTLVLRNYGEFIDNIALPETPMILSMVVLAFLSAWIAKEGVEVLGRVSEIFLMVLFVIIFTTQLLILPQIEIRNLEPILGNGIAPVVQGAFSSFTFPFAESVVFLMVLSCLKEKKSCYKVFRWGLIVGGIMILMISIRNILVLSSDVIGLFYFPSYIAVTRVNIANFLQRLEITVAIVFTVCVFIKISVCLIASARGAARVFGLKDYRVIVMPITILMVNMSYILYEGAMDMIEWAFQVYPYYALPFQVFLPIATLISAEIKTRRIKSKKQNC